MSTVFFDVDGCLIDAAGRPRYEVIDLLRAFVACGQSVYVWSGGGKDYAEHWVQKLGLEDLVISALVKDKTIKPDIAIDDVEDADLGLVNVIVVPGADNITYDLDRRLIPVDHLGIE